MPARLDRTTVATSRRPVGIRWASREARLAEIGHLPSAAGVVKAFGDVGAARPVELNDEERPALFEAIEAWSAPSDRRRVASGIWDLRNALEADLHYDCAHA